MSKVACEICQKSYSVITPSHLVKHEMTVSEYMEQFPDSRLISEEAAMRKAAKISEKTMGREAHNKGKPQSEEQKKKHSETMKKKFASGELQHWNYGRTTPEETKEKISKSLIGKKISKEHRENISEGLKRKKHE